MRSALAKGLDCDSAKIQIDYDRSLAMVDLGDAEPDMEKVSAALKEGGYEATLVE